MGIDVGVVRISYLSRPPEPIYGFLQGLVNSPDYDNWVGSWDGNAMVEYSRRKMLAKARRYVKENGLTQDDLGKLIEWIKALDWDGATIMLHLYW